MIELRKMNNERFLLNHNQIECIELIPESKIVMMNHDYYIVRDTVEEIIEKIAKYNAKVQDIHREIAVVSGIKSDVSALHLRAGRRTKDEHCLFARHCPGVRICNIRNYLRSRRDRRGSWSVRSIWIH